MAIEGDSVMAEDSGDRSTEDVETLRAHIAQLQALLGKTVFDMFPKEQEVP
jgi:hypothetical protein